MNGKGRVTALSALVIAASLVACGGGGGGGSSPAPAAATSLHVQTCVADSNTFPITTNPYTFTNTIVVPGDISTQCIDGTSTDQGASETISWTSSASPDGQIATYPSILFGRLPPQGVVHPTTVQTKLPALATSISSLVATGNVTTTCQTYGTATCQYNTAFENTFVDSSGTNVAELMVWTQYAGRNMPMMPGSVFIDGIEYLVSSSLMHCATCTPSSWNLVVYMAKNQISGDININLKSFVDDAMARNGQATMPYGIPNGVTWSSVEIGTEVASGKGVTTISGYSIK